jgi:hypothetical protein
LFASKGWPGRKRPGMKTVRRKRWNTFMINRICVCN